MYLPFSILKTDGRRAPGRSQSHPPPIHAQSRAHLALWLRSRRSALRLRYAIPCRLGVDAVNQVEHARAALDGGIQPEQQLRGVTHGEALRQLVAQESGGVLECGERRALLLLF